MTERQWKYTVVPVMHLWILATLAITAPRETISLNGQWEFEQTVTAYPPAGYSRTIPVPGLVDLAMPKLEQYDAYFDGTYKPRYNWYRRTILIDHSWQGRTVVLTLRKSMYGTMVLVNGHDCGHYVQCNTPIDVDVTPFLRYGEENELVVRVGEREWLPVEAPSGTDIEKKAYIPGIWDDIFLTATGDLRIHRILPLPDYAGQQVLLKMLVQRHRMLTVNHSASVYDTTGRISVYIREQTSGRRVTETHTSSIIFVDLEGARVDITLPFPNARPWNPDEPFLYEIVATVEEKENVLDELARPFGMRDFGPLPQGRNVHPEQTKWFAINGVPVALRGSNITLGRFIEDASRGDLIWDHDWVRKMFIEIPKALHWNAFRLCIGLVPDFWYDLADKHGILLQNEFPMWFLRGQNNQIEREYTDWVWSDGAHPSIVIWDAMNESKHLFMGNKLVPRLRKLDPTRIWDLGWMHNSELPDMMMYEPSTG